MSPTLQIYYFTAKISGYLLAQFSRKAEVVCASKRTIISIIGTRGDSLVCLFRVRRPPAMQGFVMQR